MDFGAIKVVFCLLSKIAIQLMKVHFVFDDTH